MYYKESKQILAEIKKAKRILLNCHRGPDLDSIGSALAMNRVLKQMGKVTGIICPSESLYKELSFLSGYSEIKGNINFSGFDFEDYDLFLCLDSSSWDMVSADMYLDLPRIPVIVIDHHKTNTRYGKINLVDEKKSAVSELIYRLFEDWNVKIDKETATALLTGIIGDTGIFKYPNTSSETFEIANELMSLGADKDLIIAEAFRSLDFRLIKFCGEVLNAVRMDKKHKFVYSCVPYETYEKWGRLPNAKELAVDLFSQTVRGTDFGLLALEKEPGKVSISLRARTDFDTSVIAKELSGGGHKAASGGKIEGVPFGKAVEKVLRVARKYAKLHNKS